MDCMRPAMTKLVRCCDWAECGEGDLCQHWSPHEKVKWLVWNGHTNKPCTAWRTCFSDDIKVRCVAVKEKA
jgi:hypothetical protein